MEPKNEMGLNPNTLSDMIHPQFNQDNFPSAFNLCRRKKSKFDFDEEKHSP
jgi:hypothetical protein